MAIALSGSVNQAFSIGSVVAWMTGCASGWTEGDDLRCKVRLPLVVKKTLEPTTVSMTEIWGWPPSVALAWVVWLILSMVTRYEVEIMLWFVPASEVTIDSVGARLPDCIPESAL